MAGEIARLVKIEGIYDKIILRLPSKWFSDPELTTAHGLVV